MKQKESKQTKRLNTSSLLKALWLSCMLAGFAITGNAQLQYGIKANLGGSCQSDLLELANNCDFRFAYSFGAVAKYQVTDGFALKSGLEYQQKGREIDENGTDLSNKLKYLNLPLKAEFSAGENAGFTKGQRVYFAVGPYLGYLLDADGELNGNSFDLKADTKDFDLGLGFEIGFEFPVLNEKSFLLGLNYDMGLTEIYKSEKDLHNKMASVSLGLMF